jgi:hypothetical protein
MKLTVFFGLVFAAVLMNAALFAPAVARTMSVVTFGSKQGIVLIDSRKSLAAYRLFESLNVPAETRGLSQVKILAPEDGSFRISCMAVSADYSCAVIVYPGAYAKLDFETDSVELRLPASAAKHYVGLFGAANKSRFDFETEDHRLRIAWSGQGLTIICPGRRRPRDL